MSLSASVVVARVLSSPTAVKQNPLKRKREDETTGDTSVPMAMHEHTEPCPPSWEVLNALGYYMDPETLAVASCVSTTWLKCFSSEDLWKSIVTARSTQRSSPYEIALENTELISYKHLVSAVETDAKRRRKGQRAEAIKISLSDLSFIVHVSTKAKKASVYKKGKDLVFGPNDKFHIEADVSSAAITAGEDDVRMTWQVMHKGKFFTLADTTRTLDAKYGWFTDELEDKYNRKLVGDVRPSYNGNFLEKIGFAMVDSDGWGSLLLDGFLSSQIFRESDHMNQLDQSDVSNGAGKVKEPKVISPGGSKTEERQNLMGQDSREHPHGEANMEGSISAQDVIRAGGFGAKDDIGSFLPVASDSTDFEESIRSARDYEEAQAEVQRPGLGWTKE